MTKLIILDRDGVINYDSVDYIKSPAEWQAIPGSLQAIAELNQAGFSVVIATNQSGIARGYYDLAMLERIHEKFTCELAAAGGHVDGIYFCAHHPDEHCACRKPKPGLVYEIQKKFSVPLTEVFFIGDKISDVETARAVGCKPLLVLTGLAPVELIYNQDVADVPVFPDLARAVHYVVAQEK